MNTSFRDDFTVALNGGASHVALLEIVLRHKSRGLTQRDAYQTLESIRRELGCSEGAGDNAVCERLDDVMDRVWGYCSAAKAIWETSLSEGA